MVLYGFVLGDTSAGPAAWLVVFGDKWYLCVRDGAGRETKAQVTAPRSTEDRLEILALARAMLGEGVAPGVLPELVAPELPPPELPPLEPEPPPDPGPGVPEDVATPPVEPPTPAPVVGPAPDAAPDVQPVPAPAPDPPPPPSVVEENPEPPPSVDPIVAPDPPRDPVVVAPPAPSPASDPARLWFRLGGGGGWSTLTGATGLLSGSVGWDLRAPLTVGLDLGASPDRPLLGLSGAETQARADGALLVAFSPQAGPWLAVLAGASARRFRQAGQLVLWGVVPWAGVEIGWTLPPLLGLSVQLRAEARADLRPTELQLGALSAGGRGVHAGAAVAVRGRGPTPVRRLSDRSRPLPARGG